MKGEDVFKMDNEDLIDEFNENPGAVLGAVADRVKSGVEKTLAEKEYQGKVEKTFTDYEKENPDFKEMWD